MSVTKKDAVEKVESWSLEDIRPYENNVKIHDEDQVKEIAASIKRFGPDQPIVVDGSGVIIKGHGRLMAAKLLGMKKFPVIVRTDLTADEANASRIVDNRVARTDDDTEKLKLEIDKLVDSEDLSMDDLLELGFEEKELNFSIYDFASLNEDETIDSLEEATESQISKTEDLLASLGARQIGIHSALGFKYVPGEYASSVAEFISLIAAANPDDEANLAFGKFAQEFVKANSR